MSIKSVASVVVAVAAFVSLAGCGAPPGVDDDVDDVTDETSSALHPRDDFSGSPHPRMPSFERPVWDLTPFLEDMQQSYGRLDNGRCSLRYVRIYDPARGRTIELPVTECP